MRIKAGHYVFQIVTRAGKVWTAGANGTGEIVWNPNDRLFMIRVYATAFAPEEEMFVPFANVDHFRLRKIKEILP